MFTQIAETKEVPIVYDSSTMGNEKTPPKTVLPIRVDEETAARAKRWQSRYRRMSGGASFRAGCGRNEDDPPGCPRKPDLR
jgi:hypothetical protein